MGIKFEVGCRYEPCERDFGSIKIIRRTGKTVWVEKDDTLSDAAKWKMRIRIDSDGDEYVVDSSVPVRWRDAFTYKSKWKVQE